MADLENMQRNKARIGKDPRIGCSRNYRLSRLHRLMFYVVMVFLVYQMLRMEKCSVGTRMEKCVLLRFLR